MNASTTLAASGLVRTGPGRLAAVLLAGGSDAASATIYDNTAGSGTVLAVLKAAAGVTVSWAPPGGQAASLGLYAALTGTTPSATVVYA